MADYVLESCGQWPIGATVDVFPSSDVAHGAATVVDSADVDADSTITFYLLVQQDDQDVSRLFIPA